MSHTAYKAASGQCQSDEQKLNKAEYEKIRSEATTVATAAPTIETESPESAPEPTAQSTPPQPATAETPKPTPAPVGPPVTVAAVEAPKPAPTAPAFPIIPADAKLVRSGTAFFVAKHGILITNHHVIEDCRWIGIFQNGDIHSAMAIADSKSPDLAIISSDVENGSIAVFSDAVADIGEDSYVAGYPLLDLLWALNFTNGIISSQSPGGMPAYLQTTAAVQPGNSGGPVFDNSGRVIGVVVSQLADTSTQNVNFAIKSGTVVTFMRDAGVVPKISTKRQKKETSAIARAASGLVVPALCFK